MLEVYIRRSITNYHQIALALLVSQAVVLLIAIMFQVNRNAVALSFLGLILLNLAALAIEAYIYLEFGAGAFVELRGLNLLHLIFLGPLLYLYLRAELWARFWSPPA